MASASGGPKGSAAILLIEGPSLRGKTAEDVRLLELLDHPAFHPIWQACVETDLPACFHGGTTRPPYGLGTFEMGNTLFIQHSATNPFER